MNDDLSQDKKAIESGYFPFMEPGEKTVFMAPGVLDNIIDGYLVLTDKKLFFYFYSNIARDKKFIATYPYIISVKLNEGLIYSTLTVKSKKECIKINKLKKKDAGKFHEILSRIIKDNKK